MPHPAAETAPRDALVPPLRERLLIGAAEEDALGGGWLEVRSPADDAVVGHLPRGEAADVDRAVAAALAALPAWRDRPPRERGRALALAADAVEAEAEEIARLCSRESGNAIRTQTRGEVAGVVDCLRYFSGLAGETKGETVPLGAERLDYSRREPLGVVGAIVPWNAPLLLAAVKIAPALVTGNTVVLKPSEEASLAVLAIARILRRFVPAGVLNVVTGLGAEAGEALINHPSVAKLSFTGSTAVGKHVMRAASERIVPVSLELGGKSPQVVFPDADEDWVVEGCIAAMRFFRQGQSCTAGSRLFVHRSIQESFVAKLVERLGRLRVGDPLDEASDMGALVNRRQFEQVCAYIEEGMATPGARLVLGGLPPTEGPLSEGLYVEPTVFTDVDNDWRIAAEEIFGPVLCVIPWDDEDEVVRMANATHYGLSAFVWTRDIGQALRTAHAIEAGWVMVNQGGGQVFGQSFGGYKQSGTGREFSLEGMLDGYTVRKHISVDLVH